MSKRRQKRLYVRLDDHAQLRWRERAGRPVGRLADLIAVLLLEQLGVGLRVKQGRAVLPLYADKLDIPRDLEAHIDPPNVRGIWWVITFKPISRKGA